MSPPRPILKRSPRRHNNAVHFPSSPILTRIFPAHSPTTYDRTPIVVEPNACALPERGCPGRTYNLVDDSKATPPGDTVHKPGGASGKHLHPRAVTHFTSGSMFSLPYNRAPEERRVSMDSSLDPLRNNGICTSHVPLPPPLVPDISSSESEESDGIASPPVEHACFPAINISRGCGGTSTMPVTIPSKHRDRIGSFTEPSASCSNTPKPFSFLPHPPSSVEGAKPRKRRDRTRPPQRDPCATVDEDGESEREASMYRHLDSSINLTSCTLDDRDEGCLAGF